ncbi:hypothetical protein NLJ89_g829 [Agrocybe chaxingu]|uniref:F-box domain-containing protein n=1 Tax=Agrocybe chaxingu TaxID=84603 RepID=A0A9W8N156_9AGAR|nr:hypothetical protein NLJ89_g829 [Agrocybe chaxingu]
MPTPQLPPELLYDIINHLGAEGDYASLCACASTCRALISPARAHIFRSLTLSRESRTLSWLAKLESEPHIRTYIKHLCVAEYHRPWIQSSEALHRTLGLLSPYVVSLDIHHQRRKLESVRFDFPVLSQLKCVEQISLTEQDPEGQAEIMRGDNALPTFLNHFPNLRAITFGGCWVQVKRADDESGIATPGFQLERLYTDTCYDALVLDWLVPALSSLKTLRLVYNLKNQVIPIFSATACPQFESLEHVDVRGLNNASDAELLSLIAALTHTVSLRSITTINSQFKFASEDSPIIEVVVQFLCLLHAHRHLRHLTIGFFEEDDLVRRSPWDELQDLLLGGRFPALQSVKFVFWSGSSESNPVTTEPFFAAVPRLVQKKMVSACYYR